MSEHDHPPYGDLAKHIWSSAHGFSGSLSIYSNELQSLHESLHRTEDGITRRNLRRSIPTADAPADFLRDRTR